MANTQPIIVKEEFDVIDYNEFHSIITIENGPLENCPPQFVEEEIKHFKCDVCQKPFKLKKSVVSHTVVHTNDNPFKCEICQKSFRWKSTLVLHSRVHTIEKPYKCVICQKLFTQQYNLNRHKSIHTGQKHFKCDTCKKSFRQINISGPHTDSYWRETI